MVGYVAEPLIGQAIGTVLGMASVPSAVGVTIGTVFALLLATMIQMLFGELFPKNLAIARPRGVAVALAGSTKIYLGAFGWLIKIFDGASNLLLKALKIEPVHDVEYSATSRDLEHIVADSRDSGDLRPDLSLLLDRILEFPEQTVEHAMIPRPRVDLVDPETTLREVRDLMVGGHSRYPVVDGDDVLGIVHLADVLGVSDERAWDAPVTTLLRPPVLVPTTMSLPDALGHLRGKSNRLVCVIDEYGGFAGVISAEDLAEEIVGEITDEHDPEQTRDPLLPQQDGSWLLPGDMPVDEVERLLDRELPEGDYETVAGLVILEHGDLPDPGDEVVVRVAGDPADYAHVTELVDDQLHLEVVEVERHVPSLVRMRLEPGAAIVEEEL